MRISKQGFPDGRRRQVELFALKPDGENIEKWAEDAKPIGCILTMKDVQ
jgi:hypothetical protein